MNTSNQFDWVDFYKEFAGILRSYRGRRQELISKVRKIYEITGLNLPTLERDNQIVDIDPFTVFGLFNKKLTDANRLSILQAIASLFEVKTAVPTAFDSIPVLNPQNATFYYFVGDRADSDIDELWELFETALDYAANPTAETVRHCRSILIWLFAKKEMATARLRWGFTGSRRMHFLIWIRETHGIYTNREKSLLIWCKRFRLYRRRSRRPNTLIL